MGKSAVLLALIGLVVGLWLGFNPTTHRELVRWWDRTTASQAHTRGTPAADVSLRHLDHSITRWFRSESRPQSTPPESSSPVPSATQINATLLAFWHAIEQAWVRLLLSLGIKHL